MSSIRRLTMVFVAGLTLVVLVGCISIAEINRARFAVDASWQRDLDELIEQYATREEL